MVCRFVVLPVVLRTFILISVVGTLDDSVVDNSKINDIVFFETLFLVKEQGLYFFNGVRICASENGSDKIVIVLVENKENRI